MLICISAYSQYDEFVVKAVYLEKFTRFITWPERSDFNNQDSVFTISVIGKTPITQKLNEIYTNYLIKNKKVVILELENMDSIPETDLLFIGNVKAKELDQILASIAGRPVLTLSDSPGFGRKGVIINFLYTDDKISFEINKEVADQSGLTISYLLLKEATRIY